MAYDPEFVAECVEPDHHGDHYWLLDFTHDDSRRNRNTRGFLSAVRGGCSHAVEQAIDLLVRGLQDWEPSVCNQQNRLLVVAAPQHRSGPPRQSAEHICAGVAREFDWLEWVPGALVRTRSVAQSRGNRPPLRPTTAQHLESIAYRGPTAVGNRQGILLVDDVLATGATTRACRTILLETTTAQRVVGLYLARVRTGFTMASNEDSRTGRR